jgi:hypothetical protein
LRVLSKGLLVVVEVFARPLTVGRGSPAASYFLLTRQKKVTQEKAPPLIPEFPKTGPAGWAAKNSPRFCYFELVFCERASNTFAADPPGRPDFRRD